MIQLKHAEGAVWAETTEQLAQLPDMSIVVDPAGYAWQRLGAMWHCTARTSRYPNAWPTADLPVQVLDTNAEEEDE